MALVAVINPRYGPPKAVSSPSGWPSPTAMSAPHSPGVFKIASEMGFTPMMYLAPAACVISPSSSASSSRPKKFGCWT